MEPSNEQVVQRIYEEVSSHQAFPARFFHADCVADLTEVSLDQGIFHGFSALQEALGSYFRTFEDFHVSAVEVLHSDGDRVVTAIRDGGRIRGSGAEVWNDYFHAWTLRDGKVARLSSHTDRAEALKPAARGE